jgi:hypothetical protein
MGEDMYCGVGPIPKGKIRGTPEYCVQTNQVRFYGLEAIDESLLKQAKGKTSNLIKEQLKLKKIEDDAKILIKDVKNVKLILEENATPAQQKKAQKKMDDLLVKRDGLIKKLKTQKQVVETLEKEEKRKKASKKKSSGSKTKKKSSGSKTKKKSSGKKNR